MSVLIMSDYFLQYPGKPPEMGQYDSEHESTSSPSHQPAISHSSPFWASYSQPSSTSTNLSPVHTSPRTHSNTNIISTSDAMDVGSNMTGFPSSSTPWSAQSLQEISSQPGQSRSPGSSSSHDRAGEAPTIRRASTTNTIFRHQPPIAPQDRYIPYHAVATPRSSRTPRSSSQVLSPLSPASSGSSPPPSTGSNFFSTSYPCLVPSTSGYSPAYYSSSLPTPQTSFGGRQSPLQSTALAQEFDNQPSTDVHRSVQLPQPSSLHHCTPPSTAVSTQSSCSPLLPSPSHQQPQRLHHSFRHPIPPHSSNMEPYDHGTTRQSETHGYQSSSSSPLHPNAHHSSRYSVHAHHTSSHPSQYGVEDQYGRHPSQSIPSSPPLYHQGLLEDHRSSLSSSLPRHSDYSSYSHLQQQQQQQHQSQSLGFSHHPDYGYPTHASPPPSSHPNHHHHHSLPPPQRRTSPSPQYAGYPHTSGSDYPHHVRQQSSQSYVSTPTSRSHHNGLQRIDTRPDITGVSSSSMPGPSLPVSPPSSSSSSSTSMSTTAAGMLGGGGSPVSSRGAAATATTSPDTSSPMNMMNVVSRHLTENPPRRRRRPNESYSNIIIKAIWNSEHKRLKLSEIYEYVKKELPQSQFGDDKGWQNTVRHNLSLNPCFRRETAEEAAARSPTSPTEDYDEAAGSSKGKQTKPAKRGKGGYWVLDMDELDENLKPKKYASDQQPQQQQQNQQSQRSQPQSPQQPPQQQVERLQENSLEGNERRPIQSACASISRSMTNNSSNSSGSAAEGRTREGGVRKTATSAYSTGMSTSHLMDIDSEVVSVVQSETPSTTTHNPGSVMAENEIWRQSYSAGNESRRQSQSDNASDRSMCSDIEDGDEEDEVVDDDEDDIETDKGDEDMKQDSLELEPWPSTAGRVDAIGSSSWESRRSNLHHHGRGAMSLVSLLNPVGDSTDELYNDNH